MVFNATFNNISVISWQSVLLVEKTGENGETTDLSQVTITIYLYFLLHVMIMHIDILGRHCGTHRSYN